MYLFDVAVLGGGPVGLCAAICAARLGRRVLLVTPRLPDHGRPVGFDQPRVEALPVATLTLLNGLGVAPGRLGAVTTRGGQWTAWETAEPVEGKGAPTVHVERTLLDGALADVLRTDPRITVRKAFAPRGAIQVSEIGRLERPQLVVGWCLPKDDARVLPILAHALQAAAGV